MNFCSDSVSGKYIKVRILLFPIASFVFAEIHIQYFFSVRYRKSNELKSRALLGRSWHLRYLHISLIQCCRYLCGNRCICTGLIFAVADAIFKTEVICNLLFFELADTFQPVCHVQLHLHLVFSGI